MKKIIGILLVGVFLSTLAYAQSATDDATAQDLSAIRKKLSRLKREMDLMMKDIITAAPATGEAVMSNFGNDVNCDVVENDKNIVVKADLPGMQKDKINITLERDRFLRISGSREIIKSEKSPGVVRQERFSGKFEKVVELPSDVMPVGISATYKDGVLEVTIPKKAKVKEEEVKISIK